MTLRLRTLIDERFTTLNQEFTFAQLDENFIKFLDLILQAGADNIAQFDPAFEYKPGEAPLFVGFGGNIYENVALSPHTGVTPGTDPLIWNLSSEGALSHEQNTDLKLGRYVRTIFMDSGLTPETFNLTTLEFRAGNRFILSEVDPGPVTYNVSLITGALMNHMFLVQSDPNELNSYTFQDDANQDIQGIILTLEPGDWAVFERIGNKTTVLYSNRVIGAGGHTLQEPDGTVLPQRDNLRAIAPLTFSNPALVDYTQLELDPAETLAGLELNQTVPQTVTGGKPIFEEGIETPEIKTDGIEPTDFQVITGSAKTLELMTPVYADIDFPIIVRSAGVGRPAPTVFNGRLEMPEWGVNDFNVCESQELIHEWKEGSTVSWHIHMTTNGTNVDDRYVKFELEYAYSEDGLWIFPDVFITPDILIPANTPSRKQLIVPITSFTSAGSKIGDHVLAYFKRIPADGTAPTGNPWIPMLQLHVLKDTLGSRNIGTK